MHIKNKHRIEHGNLHKNSWKHPLLTNFEFWIFNVIACRIRFYFQICLNKTVADEFFADETRFRCIEFMPGTLTFWYNMQCIWCTNLTNINHVTRYKYIWSWFWIGRQTDGNKSTIDLRIWKGRRFKNTLKSDRDLR
jgi:hypothetical protein